METRSSASVVTSRLTLETNSQTISVCVGECVCVWESKREGDRFYDPLSFIGRLYGVSMSGQRRVKPCLFGN